MEVLAEGKQVTMRFEGGETFMMKTEGQDTTTGYPTLREAIHRTFPIPSPPYCSYRNLQNRTEYTAKSAKKKAGKR
jgi:hypothetical protein